MIEPLKLNDFIIQPSNPPHIQGIKGGRGMRTLNKRRTSFNWSQYRQALPTILLLICASLFLILLGIWQIRGGNY